MDLPRVKMGLDLSLLPALNSLHSVDAYILDFTVSSSKITMREEKKSNGTRSFCDPKT